MRSAISVYKRSRSQPGVGDGRDDHYLIPTASGPKTRYFGRSSVFSLTVEVLARAQEDPQCSIPPLGTDTLMTWQPQEFNDGCNCTITKELVSMSIALYMSSLNTLYPFLDAAVVETDVEIYWQIYNASKDPSTRDETFQFFRITMITAIAFASRSRHNPSWIVYDNACYLQAAKCIETVTSEISVESLQALMLLIIYCLFRPRKGDIWKLLDYACRLSIELGYHTEQGPAEIEEEVTVQEKRRSTFWSLYTIERIVGQIFGRPSDLPETIFTTKYPDVAGAIELEGDEVAQRFSAAHHYRLVYLRSEIYKEIYLPSSPPVYPLEWYESRLSPILDWYRRTKTTKPEEQLEGVGTVTCSVAFHSTVIFVFQPIILHLLRKTRDGEQRQFHTPELFPEDGFYSACRLIQVYDKVVRSREDSILGTYPMTFMSAHYCWIAAMTIMAHCLLLLDGRLTPKRLVTDPRLLQETSSISLNNIFDISGSCLTLLMFCAEQWPGMISMVDVYRKLSSRILPQVIRKGIF